MGKERTYTYSSDVHVNQVDAAAASPLGYRISGIVRAGAIWGTDETKLLKFTLITPRILAPTKRQPYVEQKSYLNTAVNKEFFAVWHLGTVTSIYAHAKEDPSLINLKKAIVSLFQYQLLDGEHDETDVSGECRVVYAAQSATMYSKVKQSCRFDNRYSRKDAAIGVKETAERSTVFKVTNDGTLEKADGREVHQFAMAANPSEGNTFCRYKLKIMRVLNGIPPRIQVGNDRFTAI